MTSYDLHDADDVRFIDAQLAGIHELLTAMLKNGPNALPDEIVEFTSPTPRGISDLARAGHHVSKLRQHLAQSYVGLR